MMEETKNAAFYIRVSTHYQEELSPESQKRLLLDYAKTNNLLISKEHIYIENGISGRKADKRPQFLNMIAAAKSKEHPIDVILVWKFSRFARNQEESIVYKSMLKKYNVDVISVSEPLVDGPFGSLIERIIEWMDEFYSIRLAGEVTRGMTEKALQGNYQCRPPLGYKIPYHGATPEIVPEEAEIIKMIFHKYVNEKMSIFAITRYLNQLGLKTSRGKQFEKRSIEYILQNPGYAGDIRWNRTVNATNEIRDPSEWIIRQGHHPAIIEKELFEAAQKRFNSEYKHKHAQSSEVVRHWLGGILKCSSCGSTLSSCANKRTSTITFSFQCYKYLKGKCDHNSYVNEKDIVPAVLKALKNAMELGKVEYEIKQSKQTGNKGSDEAALIKIKLDKLDVKENRAKAAYMDGIDSIEEYKHNRSLIEKERQALEKELHNLSSIIPSKAVADQKMLSNIRSVVNILESDQFTTSEKNAALKSIVEKIVFDKENMHIDIYYYINASELS